MKKSLMIRIALLIAYCTPFAFLSVNGDATSGTMIFYGVMIISFAMLCCGIIKTNNILILYVGNALSFISSYLTAKFSGLEPMGHYFKPFTAHSLIVVISIIAIVIQMIIVQSCVLKKEKTNNTQ